MYNETMKASIFLDYENQWVALNKTRTKIVDSAKSLDTLLKRITGKKKEEVILHFVPPFDGYLSL